MFQGGVVISHITLVVTTPWFEVTILKYFLGTLPDMRVSFQGRRYAHHDVL